MMQPRAREESLVSVIVPAYDEQEFIGEALAQSYERVEVIVVDDGSRDGTAQVARSFGVRVLTRANGGPAAARNLGLSQARGEFVAILDADDRWPQDRLSRQVAHLREHPQLGLVLGLTEIFVTPGRERPAHWPEDLAAAPFPAHASSMLARASVFEEIGGFDEALRQCEDIDWLARAKDRGVLSGSIEHVVLHYRIHEGNTSRDGATNTAVLLRVLRDSVRRQQVGTRGDG